MSTTIFITTADLDTFLTPVEKTRLTNEPVGSIERYAQAVEDANSEVAGYTGDVTLSSIPGFLKRHACAMARYALYKDAVSDKVKDEYNYALAFLKKVADGTIKLPLVADPEVPESSGLGVYWTARPSVFDGRVY